MVIGSVLTGKGRMMEKVEFIESYIKVQGGDYQWSDNHGELIRCKDCVHWEGSYCYRQWVSQGGNWFCANGERKKKDG